MEGWMWYLLGIAVFAASPILGMLVMGIDRRLTARLQGRVGPPVLQPLYDAVKLWGKDELMVNRAQMVFATLFLALTAFSVLLFCLRQDILLVFLVLSTGTVFYILGAYCVRSPYANIGGNREVYQLIAYEPVFLLVIFAMAWMSGSFKIADFDRTLIVWIPLVLAAMVMVLMIKMQKSPFDVSTAHTEVISGPDMELSGRYLAMIKVAHWFEMFLLLGIMALFIIIPGNLPLTLVLMAALAAGVYFAVLVIDNTMPRMTWDMLVKVSLGAGFGLVALNMAMVALAGGP